MTEENKTDFAAPLRTDDFDGELRRDYLDAMGLRKDDVTAMSDSRGLKLLRAAAEHLYAPCEPDHVSEEELEEKWSYILSSFPTTNSSVDNGESDGVEPAYERSFRMTDVEFTLKTSGAPLIEEADTVVDTVQWFFPRHPAGSGEATRRRPRPTARTTRRRLESLTAKEVLAEIGVRASQQASYCTPHDLAEESVRQLLHTCACCHGETEWKGLQQPLTDVALGSGQYLLVLADNLSWAPVQRPGRSHRSAAGEYLWSEPGGGRGWVDDVAQFFGGRSGALGAGPAAVLLLSDPLAPPGGSGMAALVPVPKEWQPVGEHMKQFEDLLSSKVREWLISCQK
ncbi:hypothetical protein [Streptomyces sp. NPDC002205]|uniref:hypothetical protein n=1 Tax=Streptomyces sp. NPDC002205 TaxID=3154411 RepID=UPI00333201FE